MDRLAHRVSSVISMRPARRSALMARQGCHALWPGPGSDLGLVLLVEPPAYRGVEDLSIGVGDPPARSSPSTAAAPGWHPLASTDPPAPAAAHPSPSPRS